MSTPNIESRYLKAQEQTVRLLATLDFAHGEPKVRGLNGWVFEQIVRDCIERELKKSKISCAISEQESIGPGRATVDLVVGSVALEIKASGFYDSSVETKYAGYRKKVEKKGWEYFYLTLYEDYEPYRQIAKRVFGRNRFFVLSDDGEWECFSRELIRSLKKNFNHAPDPTALAVTPAADAPVAPARSRGSS
jgi:hypothetical protein